MKRIIVLLFLILSINSAYVTGQTKTLYRNGGSSSKDSPKEKFVKVSRSFSADAISEIHILKNKFRNLDIRIGGKDSLRIVANVPARSLRSEDQTQQWKDIKINTRTEEKKFFIEPVLSPERIPLTGGATTLKRGDNDVLFNKSLRKSMSQESIIIYIPGSSKIYIDSEFSDVRLMDGFTKLALTCNNCFIDVPSIKNVKADIKYSDLMIESIDSLDLSIKFGTLSIKKADIIDIRSDLTQMKFGDIAFYKIKSLNDEINIDNIGVLMGTKDNGHLRIKKLNNKLVFSGNGSDVIVDTINPLFKMFDIRNKFANIDVSLAGLTDYSIKYRGIHSTLYAPFEFKKTNTEDAPLEIYKVGSSDLKENNVLNLDFENCKTFLK